MTTTSPEAIDRWANLTMEALACAITGDQSGVNDAMNTIAAEGGWGALYGATLAFGESINRVLDLRPGDGKFRVLVVQNLETGEQGSLEDVGLGPEMNAALRIFIAFSNGDTKMASEIFHDAVKRGVGQDVTSAALAWAVRLIGPELERRKAEQGGGA